MDLVSLYIYTYIHILCEFILCFTMLVFDKLQMGSLSLSIMLNRIQTYMLNSIYALLECICLNNSFYSYIVNGIYLKNTDLIIIMSYMVLIKSVCVFYNLIYDCYNLFFDIHSIFISSIINAYHHLHEVYIKRTYLFLITLFKMIIH